MHADDVVDARQDRNIPIMTPLQEWSCVGPPPGHETDVVAGDEVVRNPVTR